MSIDNLDLFIKYAIVLVVLNSIRVALINTLFPAHLSWCWDFVYMMIPGTSYSSTIRYYESNY